VLQLEIRTRLPQKGQEDCRKPDDGLSHLLRARIPHRQQEPARQFSDLLLSPISESLLRDQFRANAQRGCPGENETTRRLLIHAAGSDQTDVGQGRMQSFDVGRAYTLFASCGRESVGRAHQT
jgi:hypothetical protein